MNPRKKYEALIRAENLIIEALDKNEYEAINTIATILETSELTPVATAEIMLTVFTAGRKDGKLALKKMIANLPVGNF